MIAALVLAGAAGAHPERHTYFPDGTKGAVPKYRTTGPLLVVCKPDSAKRIKRAFRGSSKTMTRLRNRRLALVKKCKFQDIQAAVNKAHSNYRIQILPGIYKEQPSLDQHQSAFNYDANMYDKSKDTSPCKDDYVDIYNAVASGLAGNTNTNSIWVPDYEYHYKCPNQQNLIAITGDGPDPDRVCDDKCNLQIEGMGRTWDDVVINGSRSKLNVIRADRADGIFLKNFTVRYSDFNNIYVLETNGFRLQDIKSEYSREYGVLSFTSDHGLYKHIEAYGSGDSGVYPGSGPEGHCARYGIEITGVDSHNNTLGYSGTSGNGVWAHNNKFHDNATGMTTDSFAYGHPGMPQDCAKFENNEIYSNNFDVYTAERDEYCRIKNRPILKRDPKIVCPTFQAPLGTGIGMFGANANIVRGNYIYDNWRDGLKLLWVPANFRGESNPTNEIDTSFDNHYTDNHMGVRPDGTRDPNGNDFWWDGEGKGNCWQGNVGPAGAEVTSNQVLGLPTCPGATVFSPGNPEATASQVTCSQWDPQSEEFDDPPGCDWFTPQPEPR